MTGAEIAPILTAAAAVLTVTGAGVKWLFDRIDRRVTALEAKIATLEAREKIYMRRIWDLELTMTKHGVPLPETEDWPP